jgi:hypothetical protein
MNQPFSIVPPPDLVQQWVEKWHRTLGLVECRYEYIATQAAQWGAEQELEACLEHLFRRGFSDADILCLRAARRPKPPSLKEQALRVLVENGTNLDGRMELDSTDIDTIRRALEALPND